MDLTSVGVPIDDIQNTALTNAPLQVKCSIITTTVNYFSTAFSEACEKMLTSLSNITWVIDVLAQGLTLPLGIHSDTVTTTLDVFSRLLMCAPQHSQVEQGYDVIVCRVMRSMTLLFSNIANVEKSDVVATREAAKVFTHAASIWTSVGIVKSVAEDTWSVAIRVILAVTKLALNHPSLQHTESLQSVMISTFFEVLLRSGSTSTALWSLVVKEVHGLLHHHSMAIQWSQTYRAVTVGVQGLFQHPTVPKPTTITFRIQWEHLPRTVRSSTTIQIDNNVKAVVWAWRCLLAMTATACTGEGEEYTLHRIIDAIRDAVLILTATYHWPKTGISVDTLMELYGPILLREIQSTKSRPETRASALAALCPIFIRPCTTIKPPTTLLCLNTLSSVCFEVTGVGKFSPVLCALLCNTGTLFTSFPAACENEVLCNSLVPVLAIALLGTKDIPQLVEDNEQTLSSSRLSVPEPSNVWVMVEGEIDPDEVEASDGVVHGAVPIEDGTSSGTHSRRSSDVSQTGVPFASTYVTVAQDEWFVTNALRVLLSLAAHNTASIKTLASIFIEALKQPYSPRVQVLFIKAATVMYHTIVGASTLQSQSSSRQYIATLKNLMSWIIASLTTPVQTWADSGDVLLHSTRFLGAIVNTCDKSRYQNLYAQSDVEDIIATIVTTLATFLSNLRALCFKGSIESHLTQSLFCSSLYVLIDAVLYSNGYIAQTPELLKKLYGAIEIGVGMGTADTFEVRELAILLQSTLLNLSDSWPFQPNDPSIHSNATESDFVSHDVQRMRHFQCDQARVLTLLECKNEAIFIIRDSYGRYVWRVTQSYDDGKKNENQSGYFDRERSAVPPNEQEVTRISTLGSTVGKLLGLKPSVAEVFPSPARQRNHQTPPVSPDSTEVGRLFLHSIGVLECSFRTRFSELVKPTRQICEGLKALDATPPFQQHIVEVLYVVSKVETATVAYWISQDNDFSRVLDQLGKTVTETPHERVLVREKPTDVITFIVRVVPLQSALVMTHPETIPLRLLWLHKSVPPNPNSQDSEFFRCLNRCDTTNLPERSTSFPRDMVLWNARPGVVNVQLPSMSEHLTTMLLDHVSYSVWSLPRLLLPTLIRTSQSYKLRNNNTLPWSTRKRMISKIIGVVDDNAILSDVYVGLLS